MATVPSQSQPLPNKEPRRVETPVVRARGLISLVIATRSRAAKLKRTLEAIQALAVPAGTEYEIIVVDNGSTDETPEVCSAFAKDFGGRFRRVYLSEPGLGRARNAGVKASRGEILGFLDDDILPRQDWMEVVWREFGADSHLGVLSGQVELFDPADLPITVRRYTERIEFQSLGAAFSILAGCNFALRRRVVEQVGLFDPDLGAGSRFSSAEDSDFFYRAWRAGEKLVYIPSLFVLHDHGRRTREAEQKITRGYVLGRGAFYAKHILRGDRKAAQCMYWEIWEIFRDLFERKYQTGWKQLPWLLTGFVGYSLLRGARTIRSGFGHAPPFPSAEKDP